jgi:hypothetical protein
MKQNKRGQEVCRALWNEIVENLNLSQYEKTMGGDMSFKAFALKAMRVSRSEKVRALCLDLVRAYEHYFESFREDGNFLKKVD